MGQNLNGRTAIVTGASRGIGTGIAQRLASAGATVILAARSVDVPTQGEHGTLREVANSILQRGGKAICLPLDLESESSRREFVESAFGQTGRIDILVNNAGTGQFGKIDEVSFEFIHRQAQVFLLGPWDLCRLVVPHMKQLGEGWIVNVGSMSYFSPDGPFEEYRQFRGDETPYATVKCAMHRLSAALAYELYADNIAVNVVLPVASIDTPAFRALMQRNVEMNDTDMDEVVKDFVEPIEHISEATLALVSHAPRSCTNKVAFSYLYLDEIGRSTMTLDGENVFQERTAPVRRAVMEAEIMRRMRAGRAQIGVVP